MNVLWVILGIAAILFCKFFLLSNNDFGYFIGFIVIAVVAIVLFHSRKKDKNNSV